MRAFHAGALLPQRLWRLVVSRACAASGLRHGAVSSFDTCAVRLSSFPARATQVRCSALRASAEQGSSCDTPSLPALGD